jgi:hypothetical protein
MIGKKNRALRQGIRDRDQDAKDDLDHFVQLSKDLQESIHQCEILTDCLLKIRQHHVILNGRVHRPVRESKTIRMIDQALHATGWTLTGDGEEKNATPSD